MSTRSYICIERKKPTGEIWYEGVYCHSDGYPSHNGQILYNCYSERKDVEKLISLGDLSVLDEHIEPTEGSGHCWDYDKRERGVCVFYGRDRGEEGVEPKEVKLEELVSDIWIEYIYVFGLDDEWRCCAGDLSKMAALEDVLENEDIL